MNYIRQKQPQLLSPPGPIWTGWVGAATNTNIILWNPTETCAVRSLPLLNELNEWSAANYGKKSAPIKKYLQTTIQDTYPVEMCLICKVGVGGRRVRVGHTFLSQTQPSTFELYLWGSSCEGGDGSPTYWLSLERGHLHSANFNVWYNVRVHKSNTFTKNHVGQRRIKNLQRV